jgi:hypothetical protein
LNIKILLRFALPFLVCPTLLGQSTDHALGHLDPTRAILAPVMDTSASRRLPEEYIWAQAGPSNAPAQGTASNQEQPAPRYFRRSFTVAHLPAQATLYVAGPGGVTAYLNGHLVLDTRVDPRLPLVLHVFTAEVGGNLRPGKNLLAMKVVGGKAKDMAPGMDGVLVAKIVPAGRGLDAPPLVVTDTDWRCIATPQADWQQVDLDDAAWPKARTLGPISGYPRALRWNLDAGLYDWPGYVGVSPYLARYLLPPEKVEQVFQGASKIENATALTAAAPVPAGKEFNVSLSAPMLMEQEAPSIVLDFGKEVVGWVELLSDSAQTGTVTVQYGESEAEMQGGPTLGVNLLYIPAHGTVHGPKSAFRFAKIRFLQASGPLRFHAIRLNGIYYPVKYQGSFESSDAMLNRIWEVGAYTAHLCMLDDIWDAPKRDRGPWMGDLDVSGDVIDSVFADHFLMQATMTQFVQDGTVQSNVNNIPGYSAFWVMGMADYDRHIGNKEYLTAMHSRLLGLLVYMEGELGPDHLFANRHKQWPFVDWSPYLDGDTPEARMATDFEFYRAFTQGAGLLRQLGDTQNAQHFEHLAASMKQAAESKYLDPQTGSFGARWQTNAMAVYSGLAGATQYDAIWKNVLSTVGKHRYNAYMISPYYNYYVISAMAETGHRAEALDWIRKYWGGMVREGATSFWEAYDPGWSKLNFHISLEADGSNGYYVSLSHGWSSGPTAWLMEQVLGIQPTAEGFREVTIRPDLAGLAWAKGAEPTPYGLLRVDLKSSPNAPIVLDIPGGVHATVLVPVATADAVVQVDGRPVSGRLVEDGHRMAVLLDHAGHFEITSDPGRQ